MSFQPKTIIVILAVIVFYWQGTTSAHPTAPNFQVSAHRSTAVAPCSSVVVLPTASNPFSTRTLAINPRYASFVKEAAGKISNAELKEKALKIEDVGTFFWLDSLSSVPDLEQYIKQVPCDQIMGIVLQMLPGRKCASQHVSESQTKVELTVEQYKKDFVDPIVSILKANSNVAVAVILEPDTLPNIVANTSQPACTQARVNYEEGIPYALDRLNLPNVVQYLDAGSGMKLGWRVDIRPTVSFLSDIFTLASKPKNLRGIATNVASYEGWIHQPGEWTPADDAQHPNLALNEKLYLTILSREFDKVGFPTHAIVDTSRNGVLGLRMSWLDYCNVNGAGFGLRPSSNTGFEGADAFVWVKHGGISDGTSDSRSPNYDPFCGLVDAFQPSPEAGNWNQKYFEMLLENAEPQL